MPEKTFVVTVSHVLESNVSISDDCEISTFVRECFTSVADMILVAF